MEWARRGQTPLFAAGVGNHQAPGSITFIRRGSRQGSAVVKRPTTFALARACAAPQIWPFNARLPHGRPSMGAGSHHGYLCHRFPLLWDMGLTTCSASSSCITAVFLARTRFTAAGSIQLFAASPFAAYLNDVTGDTGVSAEEGGATALDTRIARHSAMPGRIPSVHRGRGYRGQANSFVLPSRTTSALPVLLRRVLPTYKRLPTPAFSRDVVRGGWTRLQQHLPGIV